MGGVRPGFGLQAFTDTISLHHRRKLGRLGRPKAHTDPEYPCEAPALEGPELAQLHRECARRRRLDAAGDSVGDLKLQVTEETNREVKVFCGRPPELRGQQGLRLDEGPELRAMLFGDWHSKECPHS